MGLTSQFWETPEQTTERLAKVEKDAAEKLAAETAETELRRIQDIVAQLDLTKLRAIMEGKPYLTEAEIQEALNNQKKNAESKAPKEAEKETDAAALTAPIPGITSLAGAITSSERPKETLGNAVATGAIVYDPNATENGALTAAQREALYARARAAESGDEGNKIAAGRVIAALNSGDDLNLPTLAMQLQRAEAAMDVVQKFITKNGTTLTVTIADDGDGSPERIVERDNAAAAAAALALLAREQKQKDSENEKAVAETAAFTAIFAALLDMKRDRTLSETVLGGLTADSSLKSPMQSPAPERSSTPDLPSFA